MATKKTIGMTGVSSRLTPEEFERSVLSLEQEFLLEVRTSSSVVNRCAPEIRAREFLEMAGDPTIDFLLCARGGEGCADLMPFLEPFKEQFKDMAREGKAKPISGMSDNTPLLLFLADCGWPVFYGPVGSIFARDLFSETRENFQYLLNGTPASIALNPRNLAAQDHQKIDAEVTGGNLTLLNLSLKESWEFDATNKILMIEDWHEKSYAIDRVLKHFERIGKLWGLKAIILGNFIGDLPSGNAVFNTQEVDAVHATLKRFAEKMETLACPVFESKNIGHVHALHALKFGRVEIVNSQLHQLKII